MAEAVKKSIGAKVWGAVGIIIVVGVAVLVIVYLGGTFLVETINAGTNVAQNSAQALNQAGPALRNMGGGVTSVSHGFNSVLNPIFMFLITIAVIILISVVMVRFLMEKIKTP